MEICLKDQILNLLKKKKKIVIYNKLVYVWNIRQQLTKIKS